MVSLVCSSCSIAFWRELIESAQTLQNKEFDAPFSEAHEWLHVGSSGSLGEDPSGVVLSWSLSLG